MPISERYRYLIKYNGKWKFLDTYAKDPDWSEGVTDVIAMRSWDRPSNTWRKKNNRRYLLRDPAPVKDKELTFIMLQVE